MRTTTKYSGQLRQVKISKKKEIWGIWTIKDYRIQGQVVKKRRQTGLDDKFGKSFKNLSQ